jgi:hypothetical protein
MLQSVQLSGAEQEIFSISPKNRNIDQTFIDFSFLDKNESKFVVDRIGSLVKNHINIDELIKDAVKFESELEFKKFIDHFYQDIKKDFINESKLYEDGWFGKIYKKLAFNDIKKVLFDHTHFELINTSTVLREFYFYFAVFSSSTILFDIFQTDFPNIPEIIWMFYNISKFQWFEVNPEIPASFLKFPRIVSVKSNNGKWKELSSKLSDINNKNNVNNEINNSVIEKSSPDDWFIFDDNSGTLIGLSETGEKQSDIIIPDKINGIKINSIKEKAFYQHIDLESITLPEGITNIDRYTFRDCRSLKNVNLPDNLINIGKSAFKSSKSLKSVILPYAITQINEYMFNFCSSLTSITIPDNVSTIGDSAFEYCSSLTSIKIPGNVTSIGNKTFQSCTKLTEINVDSKNKNYFSLDGVLFDRLNAKLIIFPPAKTTVDYSIPDHITSIGEEGFSDCGNLKSVIIPDSVICIGKLAFTNLNQLTEIIVDIKNKNYLSLDGVLFDRLNAQLIVFPPAKTITDYSIPDNTISIAVHAFLKCIRLTNITIPNTITIIENAAFYDCSQLETVTVLAPNPPVIGPNCFSRYVNKPKFYVPADAVSNYQKADEWRLYSKEIYGF